MWVKMVYFEGKGGGRNNIWGYWFVSSTVVAAIGIGYVRGIDDAGFVLNIIWGKICFRSRMSVHMWIGSRMNMSGWSIEWGI